MKFLMRIRCAHRVFLALSSLALSTRAAERSDRILRRHAKGSVEGRDRRDREAPQRRPQQGPPGDRKFFIVLEIAAGRLCRVHCGDAQDATRRRAQSVLNILSLRASQSL